MEKIIWVRSSCKGLGVKEDDGLTEVNVYLADGWKVKQIAASSVQGGIYTGQAYVVIEKDLENTKYLE